MENTRVNFLRTREHHSSPSDLQVIFKDMSNNTTCVVGNVVCLVKTSLSRHKKLQVSLRQENNIPIEMNMNGKKDIVQNHPLNVSRVPQLTSS
jgi:hypothetical protein